MVEEDGVSENQLQLAYDLLNGTEGFWKGIVLDTSKLREKIGQLIAQGKSRQKKKIWISRSRKKLEAMINPISKMLSPPTKFGINNQCPVSKQLF